MMFGWLKVAAIRASLRNIDTKSTSEAKCGKIRLTTTTFSKPDGPRRVARKISPIPPAASRLNAL